MPPHRRCRSFRLLQNALSVDEPPEQAFYGPVSQKAHGLSKAKDSILQHTGLQIESPLDRCAGGGPAAGLLTLHFALSDSKARLQLLGENPDMWFKHHR